jgi:hypothetical protein
VTVVIYAGKAEVIERRRTHRIEDAGGSCTCLGRPRRDLLKQALEFGFGHGSRKRNKGNIIRILMPHWDFPVA